MAQQRSRTDFVFRPQGDEKNLSFMLRTRFAMLGANGLTEVTPQQHPDLYATLAHMSDKAGMQVPRAYIWQSKSPVANAVAMPSTVPTIAFSESITKLLNQEELGAVIGHELGHVKNLNHSGKLYWLSAFGGMAIGEMLGRPLQRQIRNQIEAGNTNPLLGIANTAVMAARFLSPAIGGAAATRSEEYAADRHGAYTMDGDGVPLISGLQKLSEHNGQYMKPTLLGKLLSPVTRLTRSHPEFDQRRNALGITPEALAEYRATHGHLPSVNAMDAARTADLQAVVPEQHSEQKNWQQRVETQAQQPSSDISR